METVTDWRKRVIRRTKDLCSAKLQTSLDVFKIFFIAMMQELSVRNGDRTILDVPQARFDEEMFSETLLGCLLWWWRRRRLEEGRKQKWA